MLWGLLCRRDLPGDALARRLGPVPFPFAQSRHSGLGAESLHFCAMVSDYATSRQIMPHHVTLCRSVSCHITSDYAIPRNAIMPKCHVTSHHVRLWHTTQRHVTSRQATSCHATPRHITSLHITPPHDTPYLTLPCHIVTEHLTA